MQKILATLILIVSVYFTNAQNKKWTIKECVEHAMKNNISVKQADIQARIAALQYKQAKMYQLPTVNFGTGLFPQFGRTIDRTTNTFSNTEILNQNFGLQGNIDIYNWGKIKNNIKVQEFNAKAALADIEKTANDVALSVATYFLQVVATYQQIEISKNQIELTKNNLTSTQKKVEAGSLPELNALQFESQLANDSSNYVAATTNYQQALLAMKGVLNIDAAEQFDVEIPDSKSIHIESILNLQPEQLFITAINNQPSIKANKLRIKSAESNIAYSKSILYPSLTGNYSLFTNYTNKAFEVINPTIKSDISGYTNVNGSNYNVYSFYVDYETKKTSYFKQLENNFGQSLGLNLNIPIFNYGTTRNNIEQSKLNYQNVSLAQTQIEQKLKLDIYTAYTNAVNSLQKFNASKKQVELNNKTYALAYKRYEVGLLSSFELIATQANLQRAQTQLLADEYDYIFKMKLLEFYKGEGLKF